METFHGTTILTVRRAGKVVVRNSTRETVRETDAPLSAAAVACWVLPHLELHQVGALVVAVTVWGLPDA